MTSTVHWTFLVLLLSIKRHRIVVRISKGGNDSFTSDLIWIKHNTMRAESQKLR